jgi:regulation of enolase protein 1 (concanavalin A-like superfamily)
VHNSTVAMAAAAQGKPVRVAINLALNVPECPRCPQFMVNNVNAFGIQYCVPRNESFITCFDNCLLDSTYGHSTRGNSHEGCRKYGF